MNAATRVARETEKVVQPAAERPGEGKEKEKEKEKEKDEGDGTSDRDADQATGPEPHSST